MKIVKRKDVVVPKERSQASSVESVTIRVTLSRQSLDILELLATEGIYGRTPTAVAGRFIDLALQQFVEIPKVSLVNRRPESSSKP